MPQITKNNADKDQTALRQRRRQLKNLDTDRQQDQVQNQRSPVNHVESEVFPKIISPGLKNKAFVTDIGIGGRQDIADNQ